VGVLPKDEPDILLEMSKLSISQDQKTSHFERKSDKKIIGTPDYLSPEILKGSEYGEASDWWALGVIMYEFLCHCPPFHDSTPTAIFANIHKHDIKWPSDVSEEALDLMKKLLDPDPKTRLGSNGAQEIMGHPWFNGIQWDSLYSQPMNHYFVPRPKDEQSTDYFNDHKNFKNPSNQMSFLGVESSLAIKKRIEALNADIPFAAAINIKNYEYKNVDGLKEKNSNIVIKHMLGSSKVVRSVPSIKIACHDHLTSLPS